MALPLELRLPREGGHLTWALHDVPGKLALRDSLPGAHLYDRVAESLKRSAALGQPLADQLAFALPASWLVNNKAPSPVMRAWRSEEAEPAWAFLVEQLGRGPAAWLALSDDDKREIGYATEALLVPPRGGLCAVSKVLALLCPQTVPLLDDAAIALLTGGVQRPDTADQPLAGPEHFAPALDAFCGAIRQAGDQLSAWAAPATDLSLTPAQVLDRLLWVDSWGYRHFEADVVCSSALWSVRLPSPTGS
jgi:hypothetical protein